MRDVHAEVLPDLTLCLLLLLYVDIVYTVQCTPCAVGYDLEGVFPVNVVLIMSELMFKYI